MGVSSVLLKVSCGKRLLRSKKDYQGQTLTNYSCHGWSLLWVGECVLRKTQKGTFTLSMVVAPTWFHNGFLSSYLSKRWQSVSWNNSHKEHNGVKDFLKKKQFSFYRIRHRHQSKTCVEHNEQVIDKSLINSTNSLMNLLYFLYLRVICCKYCKKYMRKSNQETFNCFGRIYEHVRFNFSISVLEFKYMQRILYWIFYMFFVKFILKTFFFSKARFSEVLWLLQRISFLGKD